MNQSFQTLICIASLALLSICNTMQAQNKNLEAMDHSKALESVIVEKYYVADSTDYIDTTGGILPKGSITYRIFIDLKPDYNLQVVYGDEKHPLSIKTTTTFFNNSESYALTGFNIDVKKIRTGTIAFDSWITMGAATRFHTGILKSDDTDGSLLNKNTLDNADGLTKGVLPRFQIFNIDLNFFNNFSNAKEFATNNGGWAALGGVKGSTNENRILIAQLTTNGKLSFDLNIQVGTPTGEAIKFVSSNPIDSEVHFTGLSYK
jgi:hypothetical protein